MGMGNWAIAAVGASAARPQATINTAAIDGLPVPAIDPSIVTSGRRCGALFSNYVPIIAFVRWHGPVARRPATIFLLKTLGRKSPRERPCLSTLPCRGRVAQRRCAGRGHRLTPSPTRDFTEQDETPAPDDRPARCR